MSRRHAASIWRERLLSSLQTGFYANKRCVKVVAWENYQDERSIKNLSCEGT